MAPAAQCTSTLLMQSYFVYSAILALKLLALAPLAALVCNPEKVQRANVSDLKNLTPFWLVAALYVTTAPEMKTALALFRVFLAARFVAAFGFMEGCPCEDMARPPKTCIFPNPGLMQSYFLYSGILVLKLLALAPLAMIADNPQIVQSANVKDLKNLTPFWLLAGLYMTTSPDETIALMLMRCFVVVRLIAALTYVLELPRSVGSIAQHASLAITGFMGGWVVYSYYKAL